MIKVLVAEDEFPLLRGISRMIEKLDSDFQVVMMAKTGKEALEYLEKNSVDIVFTDINMPVVDGLQVLQYINENKPYIIRVIISGYQDFSYAQQAVRYEAKRYLIKPVDRQELYLLLQELKKQVLRQKGNEKDDFLKRVILGKKQLLYREKDQWQDKKKIDFDTVYPVYLIAKSYCTGDIEEDVFDNRIWDEIGIQEYIEENLASVRGIYTYSGKYSNEMIFLLESAEKIDVYTLFKEMLYGKKIKIPLAIAVGDPLDHIEDISEVVNQLRKTICMKWKYGEQEVIDPLEKSTSFCMAKATEETLQYMIKNGKFKGFQTVLDEIQRQMAEEKITQCDLELTLNKIILFIQAYRTVFSNDEVQNTSGDINDMVMRSHELKDIFEEFIVWCHDFMFPDTEENTEALVRRLDLYILEHYTERITTKMLAQEFGLVPSYLSKLFREYKGVTPNHYIQDIRIEKSKEILENCPSIMTKDVAFMVGYVDSSYFSKVFKKSTNMYPSEYRMMKLS